jgi:hypothetical protein
MTTKKERSQLDSPLVVSIKAKDSIEINAKSLSHSSSFSSSGRKMNVESLNLSSDASLLPPLSNRKDAVPFSTTVVVDGTISSEYKMISPFAAKDVVLPVKSDSKHLARHDNDDDSFSAGSQQLKHKSSSLSMQIPTSPPRSGEQDDQETHQDGPDDVDKSKSSSSEDVKSPGPSVDEAEPALPVHHLSKGQKKRQRRKQRAASLEEEHKEVEPFKRSTSNSSSASPTGSSMFGSVNSTERVKIGHALKVLSTVFQQGLVSSDQRKQLKMRILDQDERVLTVFDRFEEGSVAVEELVREVMEI